MVWKINYNLFYISTLGDVRAISAHGLDLWAVLDNIYPMPLGSSPAAAAVVSAMGTSAATLGTVASVAINAAGYGNGGPVNGVLARSKLVSRFFVCLFLVTTVDFTEFLF